MRSAKFFLACLFAASSSAALAHSPTAAATAASGLAPRAASSASAPTAAHPADPRAQAIAMVDRVLATYKKFGAKLTFAAIDDPLNHDFHKGDLYPFVFSYKGICLAHGALPALIGKNLIGMRDPSGEYTIKVAIKLARRGGGWYYYKWPNPVTHEIQNKASYVKPLGRDAFVGVGIYRAAR